MMQSLKLAKSEWLSMLLVLAVPLILYVLLPAFNIREPGELLSFDVVLLAVMGLLAGFVAIYVICVGASRYHIIPIVALFVFQIAVQAAIIFHVPSNFKSLYLIAVPVTNLILFSRYKFNPLLAPFIPLAIFWGVNVLYTFLDYGAIPNPTYNPDMYFEKPKAFIPLSYNIDLTFYLTYLISAVYITFNAFNAKLPGTTKLFKQFIITFLLLYGVCSVGMYFANDHRFLNFLGGVKRLSSLNAHTNFFAFFISNLVLYVLCTLYKKDEEIGPFFRGISVLAVLAGTVAVFLTFARSCNMFLLLYLGLNNLLMSKDKAKSLLWLGVMAFVGGLAFIIIQSTGQIDLINIISNRLNDDSSSSFRPMTWSYLSTLINWNWQAIFGQGIGAVGAALYSFYSSRFFTSGQSFIYHPHNSYLHVFFDYGVVGCLLYFTPMFILFKIGLKHLKVNGQLNISALILVEMLFFALTSAFIDGYLFCMETIPYWILLTVLYMEAIEGKTNGARNSG